MKRLFVLWVKPVKAPRDKERALIGSSEMLSEGKGRSTRDPERGSPDWRFSTEIKQLFFS